MTTVDLGPHLEEFVAGLVSAGRYGSPGDALRDGVRLLQEREARLAALDVPIARGMADAEAGRTRPAGDVFDRLEARYRGRASEQ